MCARIKRPDLPKSTAHVDLLMTPAMKNALRELAEYYSVPMSTVIRQAMMAGLPNIFPEWPVIYQENLGGVKNDNAT